MTEDFRRLAELATGQHGAVTASQIGDAGISPAQLRRRVQSGVLVPTGPHTFRSPLVASSGLADLGALVLDCGANTFVSGPTAAALHGFDGFRLKPPFHVTVMRGRNVQRAHHHIHTTTDLPLIDRTTASGLPTMSAARTLIDMARFVTPVQLTAALDSALRDGLISEDLLHRRIVDLRSRGRYGMPKLLAVIEGSESSRGGHSWLERRYLELCASEGLPSPRSQQVMARTDERVVRVDVRFPGSPVVVELLGYRWHRSKEQLTRDAERLNALVLEGLRPMQFSYEQVTNRPGWVADQTRRALGIAPRSVSPQT
jgi:hypothetical protein